LIAVVDDFGHLLLESSHPDVGFTLSLKSQSVSEEFHLMEKMNRVGNPVRVLAVMALATAGVTTPSIAGTDITRSEGSLKLAQASLVGQCRAAKVQIPVFRLANTSSEAVRLLAPNEQVTLAGNVVDPKGFISISDPVPGFVLARNLIPCSSTTTGTTSGTTTGTTTDTTTGTTNGGTTGTTNGGTTGTTNDGTTGTTTGGTTGTTTGGTTGNTVKDRCRQVARPPQGLVIRRQPTSTSARVGGVAYLRRVTLTTNPPTMKAAENRDWVEISAPARGWISNGLDTEQRSNLVYCQ
jgi:hypothetical protein